MARRAPCSTRTRCKLTAGLLTVLALASVFSQASPAGAVVVKVSSNPYGITLTKGVRGSQVPGAFRMSRTARPADELPNGGSRLEWRGGPVMHSTTTHVIYWDPREEFTATTMGIVNGFFSNVAEDSGLPTNVFAIAGQYTDATSNAAYDVKSEPTRLDTTEYPPNECSIPEGDQGPPYEYCISDGQLRTQLSAYISEKKLATGPTQLYFVLLPHTVVTCYAENACSNNVFCAYHSVIKPGTASEVIYADIPFSLLDTADAKGCQADKNAAIQLPNGDAAGTDASTRFADVALKYISHEFIEATTDPVPGTGWLDSATPEPLEIGDKCNSVPYTEFEKGEPGFDLKAFTPTLGGEAAAGTLYNQEIHSAHYYLQSEWDNAKGECLMRPLSLTGAGFVHFPVTPLEGESVKFTGAITDPYGHPEFTWKFGDGAEERGRAPSHEYAKEGTYKVAMSVEDALTHSTVAPVEQTITVEEPPTASFTAEGKTVKEEIEFNGEESKDKDGTIEKYVWKFGDGVETESASPKAKHQYAKPGAYTVTLTVVDSSNLTAKATREIRVIDAPTVKTEEPSAIGQAVATLNAEINPNGSKVESCVLEYGENRAAAGEKVPCAPEPGEGFGEIAISATLGNLKPATTYHFRIVAKGLGETKEAAEQSFTTLPKLPPEASAGTASSITSGGAMLSAPVNPRGAVVEECRFEYGTSVFYEASVPCAVLPGGDASPVAVSAAIGGLAANTTYHFRVVASSNAGRAEGADATFQTLAMPRTPATTNPRPSTNSSFLAKAAANANTGAVTVVVSVQNAGALSWLATFANGKFGVFSASVSKCKRDHVKLAGRCRPASIVFAKGKASASGASTVTVTLKPSASARKALATARKRKKALVVTLELTFQSSLGGAPISSTITLTIRPAKK